MRIFLETPRLVLRRFDANDADHLARLDSDPAVMRYLTGEPTPRAEIEDEVLPRILRDYPRSPLGRFAVLERSTTPRSDIADSGAMDGDARSAHGSPNSATGGGAVASSSGTVSPDSDGSVGAMAHSAGTSPTNADGGVGVVATSVDADRVGAFVGWVALQAPAEGGCREVELGYRFVASVWGRGYATEVGRALLYKGFSEFGVQRVWAQTMAVNLGSRRVLEKVGLRYVRTFHLEFEDPLPGTEQGEVEYEVGRGEWLERAENRLQGLEA
ncbi:GNAT family N-acetyltransferase [Nocardia brasiliensis]|uniref:GNAT family N-acetyltransferase n=1 Tax=Nocardia brasiliensis TaxID=37326 RepID=UPI00245853D9|nr:GNAT family N-acetyltransferase [Nocardia brasiliensis]